MWSRTLVSLGFSVLLLAGCGSGANPEPAATQSSAPPAELTAADGRDYAACADGNCEVLLGGPAEIGLNGIAGLHKLLVKAVDGEGIHFETQGDGTSSGSLSLNCISQFYENGGGSSCSTGEQSAPQPVDGVIAMQVAGLREGTAVLRIVSGEPGPPPASLVPRIPTFEVPRPPFGG
ncbi:hypothetical protein [Amycolatopsis magusensis]|uniref:hypothetical protein n=1 Tax=Amycolatopsis magusensis TaxID=882444 RepID=UPI003C2B4EFC